MVYFVYDVNNDGCHKARIVADGHLSDVSMSCVFSRVASLKCVRLVLLLAELNGLESWRGGNRHRKFMRKS